MDHVIKDPVCGMSVERDSFALDYLGIHYAFCSKQCQDRFKANPHVYVGVPGEKAPAQEGLEVIKRRRFRVEQALTEAEAACIAHALDSMMGVRRTDIAGDTIAITYDLLQVTAVQLESRMAAIGLDLGDGWAERLQRGFIHYLEECEVDSLEVVPHHRESR